MAKGKHSSAEKYTKTKRNNHKLDANGNLQSNKPTSGFISVKLLWISAGLLFITLCFSLESVWAFFEIFLSGKTAPGSDVTTSGKGDFKASFLNALTPHRAAKELTRTGGQKGDIRIYTIENFLSEKECDGLIQAHHKHITDYSDQQPLLCFDDLHTLREHLKQVNKGDVIVTENDFTEGTGCLNETFSIQLKTWLNSNWSYSTSFYPGESRFSETFAARVEGATGLRPEHGGKFQITSYPPGIGYKAHTDCSPNGDTRDRFATILVYLRTVEEGGETIFPELGVKVKPKKGLAIFWNNMDARGRCDPVSLHQAAGVVKGHKFILQRWYYYENFPTLGKRTPEPRLPARSAKQARVSCDHFKQGSCRWYDEWNMNHLVAYQDSLRTGRI